MTRLVEASLQSSLPLEDGSSVVPEMVGDVQVIRKLRQLLPTRPIWKEKPQKGNFLIIDLNKDFDKVREFKPSSWEMITKEIDSEKPRQFRGMAILTSSLNSQDSNKITLEIVKFRPLLKKYRSAVFVLEEKGEETDYGWRRQALKDADLVDTGLIKGRSKEKYLLWEGRALKRSESRQPVNLINKKNRPMLRRIAREVIQYYTGQGLKIISWNPIIKQLENSTYPPGDIFSLKQGWGVVIEDSDGKRFLMDIKTGGKVDINGLESEVGIIDKMRKQELKGLPKKEKLKKPVSRKGKTTSRGDSYKYIYPQRGDKPNWSNLKKMSKIVKEKVG